MDKIQQVQPCEPCAQWDMLRSSSFYNSPQRPILTHTRTHRQVGTTTSPTTYSSTNGIGRACVVAERVLVRTHIGGEAAGSASHFSTAALARSPPRIDSSLSWGRRVGERGGGSAEAYMIARELLAHKKQPVARRGGPRTQRIGNLQDPSGSPLPRLAQIPPPRP
jgi:hypothetical protein